MGDDNGDYKKATKLMRALRQTLCEYVLPDVVDIGIAKWNVRERLCGENKNEFCQLDCEGKSSQECCVTIESCDV
jgi:hypothetical protein